jgi:endo-alpha-1,4-polygalactosaminidase (GH114 family)
VAGNKLLAYGGKYETPLWRRAWKSIEKEMLKKLES